LGTGGGDRYAKQKSGEEEERLFHGDTSEKWSLGTS
jgi:hypothetical protein